MKPYDPKDFKHYEITYSDGRVGSFSYNKLIGITYTIAQIVKHLTYVDKSTGKTVKPVKVKRTK
jgi:hypothetical protein